MKGVIKLLQSEIVTVAFLQNQWFEDPKRVRRLYEKHPDRRQQFIRDFLFMGCLTGRRLEATFGDDVDQIIWEEVSKEIGGKSSSKCKADLQHIESIIEKFKPNIVLSFGIIATQAIGRLELNRINQAVLFQWKTCIHPAARQANIMQELRSTADWWRDIKK